MSCVLKARFSPKAICCVVVGFGGCFIELKKLWFHIDASNLKQKNKNKKQTLSVPPHSNVAF